ncbi:unnamed protein product [Musa acuminata subsp. malaccensis]|uniref:(wild Malaysian banana) hypothetical protein n=1 Tax=Musa acuminata subsp. malaccensis TaxID=214687 RepID=A0A8D7F1S6_MUSAM|nr:unnamed protein product [Musa acuminata subsp. malaccensis]
MKIMGHYKRRNRQEEIPATLHPRRQAQRKPQRTAKPRTMSQTIWRRRKAWPETRPLPPLPTWQGPLFATRTLAHVASGHPHQYVTPFTPQTGSGRKQLMRQEGASPSDLPPQRSTASAAASKSSELAAATRRQRRDRARRTTGDTEESRREVAMARQRPQDESLTLIINAASRLSGKETRTRR